MSQFSNSKMKQYTLKNKNLLAPIASWAACQHVAPLRFGRPLFESRLADLSRSRPPSLSLQLRFLSNYYQIKAKSGKNKIFKKNVRGFTMP